MLQHISISMYMIHMEGKRTEAAAATATSDNEQQ